MSKDPKAAAFRFFRGYSINKGGFIRKRTREFGGCSQNNTKLLSILKSTAFRKLVRCVGVATTLIG